MATRVIVGDTHHFNAVHTSIMVEDTADKSTEFSYIDFMMMLHKKIRHKGLE